MVTGTDLPRLTPYKMIGHGGWQIPKTDTKQVARVVYPYNMPQPKVNNGCKMVGPKTRPNYVSECWERKPMKTPYGTRVKLNCGFDRVPYWVPWRSGGRNDRIARILMMRCFGIFSLGVSWAIWGLCLSESMLA